MNTNLQTASASALAVALLLWVRSMKLPTFCAVVGLPALLYGLLAERTFRFGSLKGKNVLITGASSGLGKAIALEAAKRGAAKVILLARGEDKLRQVAKMIEKHTSCKAVVVVVDVADEIALRKALSNLSDEVDLLVNNAGAGAWKHTEETSPMEAVEMMAVPYQAAFAITSMLLPRLSARKGHVLNVTSSASLAGFRGAVGYATARWAMRGFSRNLLFDVKELGVGVTLLNAGEIQGTEYFADKAGKAGAASKDKIPMLFKLIDRLGVNYNTEQAAAAGLNAVEAGWATVLTPGIVLVPAKMMVDVMPCLMEALCELGPAGLRSRSAGPKKAD
ncbi:hypothetical protein AB1Y20_002393 [Prymnesium parvum]|uniref:Ketoreductase domain-containing protein n=1 Tax=Prymnesium parvum TaxID=97485 RepID=A0AB34JBM1_PRYPA|eukprot:CAMPEP_0182826064 /NCGR_PEP_ID=MMETSP0006_2-20121128/16176_1 /TAXON_ID=97485 /ORGANISM="Prymnesium parvum, Strain Texoma1" /LENGTH=333 /DNA_ID=CAMNT_0024953207 /DNA_START=15 /DNA_END=1016 /DNA_ORIENTATION=+